MSSEYQVIVTRKKVKNLIMRVKPGKQVHVSAPFRTSDARIQKFIDEHTDWIEKQLKKQALRPQTEVYTVEEMKRESDQLIQYWSERIGVEYDRIRFRKMTSRWGVCNTRTRIITLNTELTKYPKECLEYVIVHELAHIIVPGHTKAFWSIVEEHLPNYKVLRKLLR